MRTINEMVAVMEAFQGGKKIQVTSDSRTQWMDVEAPNWNWSVYDFRVKPREPRRIFVNLYQGTVNDCHTAYNQHNDAAGVKTHLTKEAAVEFVEVLKPE